MIVGPMTVGLIVGPMIVPMMPQTLAVGMQVPLQHFSAPPHRPCQQTVTLYDPGFRAKLGRDEDECGHYS
jgi:hypothetical protein